MVTKPVSEASSVWPSCSAFTTASAREGVAGAAAVLDDDALAPLLRQPLGDGARQHVGQRAGRGGHDDGDGAVGIGLRRARARAALASSRPSRIKRPSSRRHGLPPCRCVVARRQSSTSTAGRRGAAIAGLRSLLLERVERLQRLARRHLVGIDRRERSDQRVERALARIGRRRPRRCGKQRQVLEAARRGAVLGFERRQHDLGALDHARRQAGELGHLDAVGAVGRARHHLVQEHHLALPFLDPHGGVVQPRQLGRRARSVRGSGWRTSARQRLCSCRCSIAAQAIDRPSKVAVPRPISSRITSERSLGLVEDRSRSRPSRP